MFEPGDVIQYGNWEPKSDAIVKSHDKKGIRVSAFRHNITGAEYAGWRIHDTWLQNEWRAELHPDAENVWANYTMSVLLGEIREAPRV